MFHGARVTWVKNGPALGGFPGRRAFASPRAGTGSRVSPGDRTRLSAY